MDSTNRQVVSDVIGSLHSVNIDDRISNRFVLSRVKDKVRILIKQDLDSRRLFKITDIWKTIKCFHMKPVDFIECGFDIPHCECVMKSVHKLPKSFDSSYGTLVKVFTINGNKEYNQIKLGDFKDIKSREYSNKSVRYFWIDDGYVYIPDSQVEEVLVVILAEYPEEVDKLNDLPESECAKPLDSLFPCPGHLLDIAKTQTITELAQIYKRIPEDAKPDNNSNSKA